MFVEQRSYTMAPGRIHEYLTLYEEHGMPIQLQYLPLMLGYYSSEIGDLNVAVHLWGHESLDAREANRTAMRADPAFKRYWEMVRPLIASQRTQILRPAPFFVDRLHNIVAAVRCP